MWPQQHVYVLQADAFAQHKHATSDVNRAEREGRVRLRSRVLRGAAAIFSAGPYIANPVPASGGAPPFSGSRFQPLLRMYNMSFELSG